MPTVGELIDRAVARLAARGIGSPRLDAEILLAQVMGLSRASILASRGETVPLEAEAKFERLVARREQRVPVAYLLGVKEFWSLEFEINEDVLIPRPDTEWVVSESLRLLQPAPCDPPLLVADVGTGAGPIAVSLAHERQDILVHATDISGAALEVARRNARRHGVASRICFHAGDLLEPIFDLGLAGRIALVASNPPYVGDAERVDPEVIRWEPRVAVFGGEAGGEVIARLVPQAAKALAPGGWLVMEITCGREGFVRDLLAEGGVWTDVGMREDYSGLPRILTARRTEGGS